MKRKHVRSLFVLGLLWFVGGCSTYQRAWNEAGATKAAVTEAEEATTGLAGRWAGSWLSRHNGHNGALRCIMKPTGQPNQVEAWFDSRYAKVLRFKMKTTFDAQPVPDTPDAWSFSGAQNLGKLLGVYEWKGSVRGDEFESTYQSKHDHGVFTMKRVP